MSESLELFIRVDESGNAVEHPIFGDNFRQAFPNIDVNNLPSNFARFVRVARPTLDVYEVLDSNEPTYQLVDGVFTDVWSLRAMTPSEKTAKQQAVRDAFAAQTDAANFTTWTLDEATCTMVAPTPRPEGAYAWKGATNSWESRAVRPDDGKAYRWDYQTWSWVEVV
jgi:hypothetical protein